MFNSRSAALIGGFVFLIISLGALYRLLFPFPIVIAGIEVHGVASFLVFVVFAALSLVSFQGLRSSND